MLFTGGTEIFAVSYGLGGRPEKILNGERGDMSGVLTYSKVYSEYK